MAAQPQIMLGLRVAVAAFEIGLSADAIGNWRKKMLRRRRASLGSLDVRLADAVRALVRQPRLYSAMDWPVNDPGLVFAGLYAWYVDQDGAAELSKGLRHKVDGGLIYVGQTGATAWPSGKHSESVLAERIGKYHISGKVRSSTFRLTLAACLLDVCSLQCIGPRKLTPASEHELSKWVRRHLKFAIYSTDDRTVSSVLKVWWSQPPIRHLTSTIAQ